MVSKFKVKLIVCAIVYLRPLISFAGLDPANPYFSYKDRAVRLDPTDAAYVDVIHTDAPLVGTPQSVGHIDFWPNNGRQQPGCFDLSGE